MTLYDPHPVEPIFETESAFKSNASSLNFSALQGTLGITQMFATGTSAINSAMNARFQSQYQAEQARFNAMMQRLQASEVRSVGDQVANKFKLRGRKIKGAQRAAFAAQGLDPDVGSGADIQRSTDYQSTQDALTIRNNAWRQAFGLEFSANELDFLAEQAEIQGDHDFKQGLISGGLQALGYGVSSIYSFGGG